MYAYANVLVDRKVNSNICWPCKVSLLVVVKKKDIERHIIRVTTLTSTFLYQSIVALSFLHDEEE